MEVVEEGMLPAIVGTGAQIGHRAGAKVLFIRLLKILTTHYLDQVRDPRGTTTEGVPLA